MNTRPDKSVSPARIVLGYGLAALLVMVALGLSRCLKPWVEGSSPFILFVAASLIAAWYAGLGPGIAALVIGLLVADFFFVEPLYHLGPNSPGALAVMLLHVCAAGIGLAAIVNLHRARFHERQIQGLATRLEQEVVQHRQALDELREAKAQLDEHARHLEQRVADRTARLVETVKSLEGVLYHVAHDLRAPLRALSSMTQLLQISLDSRLEGEDRFCMGRIVAAAQRMDRLILDLLAYGRLGHVRVHPKETDLQRLVSNVVSDKEEEIHAKGARVEVVPPLPVVHTDDSLLRRALAELLSNALTFIAPGIAPRVLIRAEPLGSRVKLWVEDNGIGIEPQYRERVFRIFERLYPREGDGKTGIGLAVVAKTMERLGGASGVESALGQGSRFWLELPLAPQN